MRRVRWSGWPATMSCGGFGGVRFENFIVHLEVERTEMVTPAVVTGDGGRALAFDDRPAGVTVLQVLDLPPLGNDISALPRLWIAAAGVSPAWRRAAIAISGDDGASYAVIGVADGATVQGATASALRAGDTSGWDRHGHVDVELLSDAMWIEGRTPAAVLAGGNLALVGDEIIQFSKALAIGPRRFRLSGLLRGRRGTEGEVGNHAIGDRFVMLDPGGMLPFDPPAEALGRMFRVRAAGVGDAGSASLAVAAGGQALRPLSPVHLKLTRSDVAITAKWVRRSRTGFGWSDFVDAPLGEATESYQVVFSTGEHAPRRFVVAEPQCSLPLADWLADGGGEVSVTVTQLSAMAGPGRAATRHFESGAR
ncbi:GTA baseplate fiber-binding domain-containing protein [Sandarakinorhabdus glacialis]